MDIARLSRTAVMAALLLTAAAAVAQSVGDNDDNTPSIGLDLPKDLQIFGKTDPNVRKATAIVNTTIITDTDVEQRLALVIAANGGKIQDDEKERLRLQVLRNLIDETLEIQEARANDIKIAPEEIQQTFARVSANFKRTPDDFAVYLREKGSSEASIKRQIEGELSWNRLLRRRVEPFVTVSEEEVKAVIDRLNASKGAHEYRVAEIYLSATSDTQAQVLTNAQRIVEQVRKGGSFVAYARQYSEASTAAVGGDLGWVRAAQLPDALSQAVQALGNGQISDPIPVPGGFSIIALVDQRQVLMADARDALLNLKQVSITFSPNMTQTEAAPKVEAFAKAVQGIQGCGKVEEVATAIGAEVVQNDQVKIRDLPPALQTMLVNLSVGQATPPFGSLQEGVRSLVLCGRDDAQVADGPSYDQIFSQMQEERVNRRAQRYLRDLRRDAVVDYR